MDYDLQKNSPHNKTLHAFFETQVKKTPDSIALVYENVTLTYHELNERSNQLANYLIKTYAPQPDSLITLCLERTENIIIAIMAVLKTGAAYVPIDPKYPEERIRFIMEDTQTNLMIDNEWLKKSQPHFLCELKANPVTLTTENHLCYVIYTSGTTGKPKGVMLEHEGVINNAVFAMEPVYDFTKGNKVTAFASYAFDSSVPEIFSTLLRGGELHLLSEDTRMDVFKISHYIEKQNINFIYLPPVLLAILPRKKYPSLKGIIYAGEPCDLNTVLFWSQHCLVYNFYGPTEGSVSTTYKKIEHGCTHLIGKPLDNVQCYVLDSQLKPVPVASGGELYIGGIVDKFLGKFNCYGVDAYNFYHDEKIEDLKLLSQYYLTSIHKIMEQTNQDEYNLLGWSLGGKIALEMAALLEQSNITKINIYLLDTFLSGKVELNPDEFKDHLISKGLEPEYIEKSLSLLPIADRLYQCDLSSNLKHSQILLFKALLSTDYKSEKDKIFKRELSLKYNHIDKCLKCKKQIKVIKINESHANLLNQADLLASEILKFNTKFK